MEIIGTQNPQTGGLFWLRNWASVIDKVTYEQLITTARSPAPCAPICAMPDAHLGKGSTVGSVIPTRDKVMPATVGVDIGCGMIAVSTGYFRSDLPQDLAPLHAMISRSVPAGMGKNHENTLAAANDWLESHTPPTAYLEDPRWLTRMGQQLGTLGSGNHFVEVCLDREDRVWVVLHSGSRAIGMNIAERYIKEAKEECKDVALEDTDLAYLTEGRASFDNYIREMTWAQGYALANREIMMDRVLNDLVRFTEDSQFSTHAPLETGALKYITRLRINCHHNFTAQEMHRMEDGGNELVWVTRKGAIKADVGDWGIIPGSMATCTYIVQGLGNPLSYNSSSHGAGRIRSRGAAFRELDVESLREAMAGKAWNESDAENLVDEHPKAYKDIDEVMNDQRDLTEVQYELRQILNYKGADGSRRKRKKQSMPA